MIGLQGRFFMAFCTDRAIGFMHFAKQRGARR